MRDIILASGSPRRKELLSLVCSSFTVDVSDVDESKITAQTPTELTLLLAKEKCLAVAKAHEDSVVIGCDTVVELDEKILGKPKNKAHAREMINALSGKLHYVHTGVFIKSGKEERAFTVTTTVEFAQVSQQEAEDYISTKDPYDKAGGYGIQSGAARFVKGISGCYYNVMGFPVQSVYTALREMDVLK